MTTDDWDAVAARWIRGDMEPSIGREAWEAQARSTALAIRETLAPYGVSTLIEVGSGVGRLTPHLADVFPHVVAIDTSPGMAECTELACVEHRNVSVRDHAEDDPIPVGDAALVLDVIAADWSLQQADELIDACLRSCVLVLVSVSRLAGWSPDQNSILREGSDWWLLQADTL